MNFATVFSSFLLILLKIPLLVSSCQVQLCYTEYLNLVMGYKQLQRYQVLRDLRPRESLSHLNQEYCQLLDAYGSCMRGLNKQCRGRLDYHAVIAHVKKWLDDYN